MDKKSFGAGIALVLLVVATAAGASYLTREHLETKPAVVKTSVKTSQTAQRQQVAQAQPAQPQCDDGNVLGAVAGGVAGGVVGHQVGGGKGKTAATIGGTLGGAYLGKEYIPLNNVTCRK